MTHDNHLQKNTPTSSLTGFQKPNEIITPNQFFDVVLPNHSTPVIRVVGYILQQTLGYTNDDGDPFQERFCFSQKQIAREAGVAPSSIKRALDQAVAARFLRLTKNAVASSKGKTSQSAEYELRWHEYDDNAYIVDPRKFQGFFAAGGNRTNIPTEFFTHVIRQNTKAVIRFVGAVIRNTLGIKASHGKGRVKRADLSYRQLQHYLKLSSTSLGTAIKKAIEQNYVVRLAEGVFDARHPENNRKAIYTVKWCETPAVTHTLSTPKTPATTHTKNTGGPTPKMCAAIHTKNTGPDKLFPNGNRTKQRDDVVAEDLPEAVGLLVKQGFPLAQAQRLAKAHSTESIIQQIAWLPLRNPKNPLGMLQRAIENDWPEPVPSAADSVNPEANAFAQGFYAGRWNCESTSSKPNAADLEVAQRLADQLSELHGSMDLDAAHQWGASFGRQYGHDYPKLIPSLAYAGRVLADDLIQQHRRRLQSKAIQRHLDSQCQEPEPSPELLSQDRKDWLEHLAAEEPRIQKQHTHAYGTFQNDRANQRKNIQRSGLPNFARQMTQRFDSRETYLSDLQRAFPNELPSFEDWAATNKPSAPLTH